jgi:hypothetical protein
LKPFLTFRAHCRSRLVAPPGLRAGTVRQLRPCVSRLVDQLAGRDSAFYSNLPPRNYRFRVIASNKSGVWNEAGASLLDGRYVMRPAGNVYRNYDIAADGQRIPDGEGGRE